MPNIQIIGAGMAGLLAANMLRRHRPVIVERQPELPNNHHAVLRFRTDAVSRELRIPFREVRVFKSIDNPDIVQGAMHYSKKVTGRYELRSLLNLEPSTRYIAPTDLIQRMAEGLDIRFGSEGGAWLPSDPIISTMPMEALMDALGYEGPRPSFQSTPGWTMKVKIRDCDLFVTRYLTRPSRLCYRASVTGDELIVEGVKGQFKDADQPTLRAYVHDVANEMGIRSMDLIGDVSFHASRYAKIARLSPEDRRKAEDFMLWATIEHRVFSLGRFATWRAGLLLDDLPHDITKIERWIGSGNYQVKRSL